MGRTQTALAVPCRRLSRSAEVCQTVPFWLLRTHPRCRTRPVRAALDRHVRAHHVHTTSFKSPASSGPPWDRLSPTQGLRQRLGLSSTVGYQCGSSTRGAHHQDEVLSQETRYPGYFDLLIVNEAHHCAPPTPPKQLPAAECDRAHGPDIEPVELAFGEGVCRVAGYRLLIRLAIAAGHLGSHQTVMLPLRSVLRYSPAWSRQETRKRM
jgi:hypothetical protein